MPAAKKRKKESEVKLEYPLHKFIDMRVILPSLIIAFVFSLIAVFYVLDAILMPAIYNAIAVSFGWPAVCQFGAALYPLAKIIFFTVDFIVVFFICYAIFWVLFHESDKKLYREYKNKGEL